MIHNPDNRLLAFLRGNLVELLTLAYALPLVYVSILPLDFTASSSPLYTGPHLCGLPSSPPHLPDVASNIALYAPFGVLVCAVLIKRGAGSLVAAILATFLLAALSFGVEFLQQYSPSRVCSAADFLANAMGALAGGLLAPSLFWIARRAVQANRNDLHHRASAVLARLLALGLVAIAWVPFDLTFSADRVAESVRRSTWVPFARLAALQQAAAEPRIIDDPGAAYRCARDAWSLRLDAVADATGYALLAILTAWYLRRHCRTTGMRTAQWTLAACLWLAVFAAAGQVLIASRGFDGTYLLAASVGSVIGLLAYRPVVQAWGTGSEAPRSRRVLLGCVVALVTAFVVLRQTAPFRPALDRASLVAQASITEWIPMTTYLQARLPQAVADLLGKLVRFGLLGAAVTLYRATPPDPRPTRSLACGLLVALAVLGTECLQLFLPSRVPGVTDVLLAGVGAAAGVQACRLALAIRAETLDRPAPTEPVSILYNVEFGPPEQGPREPVLRPGVRRPGRLRPRFR